jgi:hypothetical protein
MRAAAAAAAFVLCCSAVDAQTISHRGFVEGQGLLFPRTAVNDATRGIGDALFREELFVRPAPWLQFAAGLDVRANTHDQVDDRWRLDVGDRGVLRPRAAVRRLTATLTAGRFTVDIGKQFIRWARTDVINPIDRFAPRDFLNVIESEFLPVAGIRPSAQVGNETFEAVWVGQLTPSRMPLLNQRWTTLPPEATGISIRDAGSRFPGRGQSGARWRHTGGRLEMGLSYFDGFNHLPHIEIRPTEVETAVEVTRVFPRLRTYGADTAVPTRWFTVKAEGAYFQSPGDTIPDYGLYVVEIERQAGEWLLTGGYAGEVAGRSSAPLAFDPERALAPAIAGRASYTVDPRRTVTIEGAARQSGDGQYVKADFSQALAQRWRVTVAGVILAGEHDDFLGQFSGNSHVTTTLRFSF